MIQAFNFAKIPFIHFGTGKLKELSKILPSYGKNLLLVMGKSSFIKSEPYNLVTSLFEQNNMGMTTFMQ